MRCGVAYPHMQLAQFVSRDSAGDDSARRPVPAASKSISRSFQKADVCFVLPFGIQCAGPPAIPPHRKYLFDFPILEGGELR